MHGHLALIDALPLPDDAMTRTLTESRSAGIAAVAMATPSWAGECLADLAATAGSRALRKARKDPPEIDLVLVATTTPDDPLPNAAPLVAHTLGIPAAGAFDVGAACTGFVAALGTAAGLIESGRCQTAVVVGADLMSRVVDPDDRDTSIPFGDGAGAVVMTATAGHGRIGPWVLYSDGAAADLVSIPRTAGVVRMQGQDTFRRAVSCLAEASIEAAELAGIGLADVDLFVFHQANGRILRAVGERLGIDQDRVVDCIARYGDTSAAAVPIALCEAGAEGRLFRGARVLVGAFGSGLTWGATVVEWGDA